MVEDTPDDLVMEMFAGAFWPGHPLGRSILGSKGSAAELTIESQPNIGTRIRIIWEYEHGKYD